MFNFASSTVLIIDFYHFFHFIHGLTILSLKSTVFIEYNKLKLLYLPTYSFYEVHFYAIFVNNEDLILCYNKSAVLVVFSETDSD